jgi:hypothetical protein
LLSQTGTNTVENKTVFHQLQSILQQYQVIYADMRHLDRYQDACNLMLSRCIPLWRRFADDSQNDEDRRAFLFQVLSILNQLVDWLMERWHRIRLTISQADVRDIY